MRQVNLSKVKPCRQNWDAMERCGEQRLCSKCNERITDFRGLTDWEVALIHSRSKTKVCGLYDPKQLRPTTKSSLLQRRKKRLFYAGIFGLLASGSTFGQSNLSQVDIELFQAHKRSNDPNEKSKNQTADQTNPKQSDSLRLIHGIVMDENQEPLVGANIIIDGTSKGTITEVSGEFRIDLSEDFKKNDSLTLVISYTGFGRMEKVISNQDFIDNKGLELDLILEQKDNKEVFYVQRPPLHKRMWYSIKNIFRNKN